MKLKSSMQRSSREERGYHKYQAENSHRQPQRKKQDTSKSASAVLASLLQCRTLPTDQLTNCASECNELVALAAKSSDSWEQDSDRYSSEEDDSDDGSMYSDDEEDGRYGVQSRGRSLEEKRGTNSRGRGGRRGRDRYRSPPPRSSRRGSLPKSSTKQKNKKYVDDETADRTRKRGNRKSDKKTKTKTKFTSGRYGRDRYASESEYSEGVVTFIKEEEDEDEDEDDYGQDNQENDDGRYNKESRAVNNNGKRAPKVVHDSTSRMPRLDPPVDDKKQIGLSFKPLSHSHEIPEGTTESMSLSPSMSSETSFTLNTNFHFGSATNTGKPLSTMHRVIDEAVDSASWTEEESELSLNTMLTRQLCLKQQCLKLQEQQQQHKAKKKPSHFHDTFQQYKRPDEKGAVEIRIPQGDVKITLENTLGGPVVSEVSAHSVAPQLRVGDVIVALDGVNVDRFPGRAVMDLLEARRTQPTRIIKYLPGNSALGFHAKMQAIALSKSESTHALLSKSESSHESKIDDAIHALEIQTKMDGPQDDSSKHMKKRDLQINTEGPKDDDSLFSTTHSGKYKI